MSSGAPVCLLPNQGQATPDMPGKLFPPVPQAQDLPSAIQAINVLRQIVHYLTLPSLPTFRNNLNPFTPATLNINPLFLAAGTAKQQAQKTARFVEVSRQTEKVKIVNPNDDSQFVIVERINTIVFMDRVTGAIMVWNR